MEEVEARVYELDPKKIVIPEQRMRKLFKLKELKELSDSIKELGQIQPGVCTKGSGGEYVLVAGERRLRACLMDDTPYRFVLREDLREGSLLLRKIELEENIRRENLTWNEEVSAKEELHRIYQQEHGVSIERVPGGHGIEATAEMLGESVGLVSEDLELAFWAQNVGEVKEAKTKTDAKKIVKRLKEQLVRSQALNVAVEKQLKIEGKTEVTEKEREERILLEYDRRCIHGEMIEELGKMADSSFDIVLFDPPWGVDYDIVAAPSAGTQMYEDSAEGFNRSFKEWIELIYRKMKKDSHFYTFF